MNSIIICEGSTDLTLIQYFMETVNEWSYSPNNKKVNIFETMKAFHKNTNNLIIGAAGCCSKIKGCFEKVIETNTLASNDNE